MIDWTGPIQFENGADATLYATLSASGKAAFTDGRASEHSDLWAEMHEQGITRLVLIEGSSKPLAYGENGVGISPWDSEAGIRQGLLKIMNVPPVSEASMAEMAESDMWGMF